MRLITSPSSSSSPPSRRPRRARTNRESRANRAKKRATTTRSRKSDREIAVAFSRSGDTWACACVHTRTLYGLAECPRKGAESVVLLPARRLTKRFLCFYTFLGHSARMYSVRKRAKSDFYMTLPTTKIALGDARARQKTRETNQTTRQLFRFFRRSRLGVARPVIHVVFDDALYCSIHASITRWCRLGALCWRYAYARMVHVCAHYMQDARPSRVHAGIDKRLVCGV